MDSVFRHTEDLSMHAQNTRSVHGKSRAVFNHWNIWHPLHLPFLWAQKRMPLPLWRLRVTVAKSKAWYEVVLVKSCEGSPRPHDHSSLLDEESVSPPNSLKIESQQIQISGGTGNNRKESIFGQGDAWRIGARPGTTEFRR